MNDDQNLYEIKGLLNLLRGDLVHYFKQIGILLTMILIALTIIAVK